MDKKHRLFLILGGFFITNTLVAEFVGIKIFSLEQTLGFAPMNITLFGVEGLGFNLTTGVMLWPVVFVMTDIINEYYGKKGVRFLSNMAVGLILYAFLMVYIGIKLAPNEWWQFESGLHEDHTQSLTDMDLAFRRIFGQGLWIIVGSLIAFLVGQIVDVLVFHRIKKATGEKKVWLRATGSTLVSQFIDSYVVLVIAFYVGADWDIVRVIAIGTVNYLYKFSLAIILTPFIYVGHFVIDRYLGKKLSAEMKLQAHLEV
jgi:uncharacterized integral membrane protein (TIGR00697 family)